MLQRSMGDSSSACLMRPFCYASGFSNEANKSNRIHALGESVSFGRFMSESLAWEKWSTFSSHNRYVEEAERISRPGSVAQMKAFFEAHYKKLAAQKAAAALLEQANSTTSKTQQEHEAEVDHTQNSHITSPKSKLVVNEENSTSSNIETSLPQSQNNKVEGAQPEKDHQTFVGDSMQNQLKDVDNNTHTDSCEKKSSDFDEEIMQSMVKKNAPVSLLDDIVAPMNNKPSLRKKRSTATKSLHMSLKFAFIREINRLTASVMRKFETTRVGAGSSTASKDSWTPLTTPTKDSKNELKKHPSFTPLTEKKRNYVTSLIISSPFGLRTEEMAASRKKKLGKKFNASEAPNVQLHIKLKEKAKIKIRKLRQSFCFKARPLAEFNKEIEDSKRWTKEDSLTVPESPKQ